jgi:hypothetical protein
MFRGWSNLLWYTVISPVVLYLRRWSGSVHP